MNVVFLAHFPIFQVIDLHLYLKSQLPQVFFKDFASKNQPPGLSIIGTLVENGLIIETEKNFK